MNNLFCEAFHDARAFRAPLTEEQQRNARNLTESDEVQSVIERLALCLDDRQRRHVACLPVFIDSSLTLVLEFQGSKENLTRIRDAVAPEIYLEPLDIDEGEVYHLLIPFTRLAS